MYCLIKPMRNYVDVMRVTVFGKGKKTYRWMMAEINEIL